MSKINLADYITCTEVEGPGKRFALWVQGCQRHCPGCCNPHFLDFVPKNVIDSSVVCELIEKSMRINEIEGVTFLGGEPMLQAKGLAEVAKYCRTLGLSVMVFTGYDLADVLEQQIPFSEELLRYTDVLADGFFDVEKPEVLRNWIGSTNQCFHFLTDFYECGIEYDERYSHGFELRFELDGTMTSNGFPLNSL
jgi:anaerobic ribonucleoside-triphosphate reductase activating protein